MAIRSLERALPLARVNRAPLRAGRVETLEARSVGVFARARCAVQGAIPDAQLELRLLVHLFDPTCSSRPSQFASARFRTDSEGSGQADLSIRTEDVPAAVRNAAHGLRWEVARDDVSLYRTECASVELRSEIPMGLASS